MKNSIFLLGLLAGVCLAVTGRTQELRGGLALQFDDGWHSWVTEVAPLVKRHGGVATGFVNDKYIESGRISMEDLLRLQNEFGWEIGTHTVNHYNAPRFVKNKGVETWLAQELDPSLAYLRDGGLQIHALVFPFNASTPEIEQAAMTRVGSFRRVDSLAVADRIRPNGSLPGTSIDTTQYTPIKLVKKWIDLAHRRNKVLFLYGHRILPDTAFITGQVVSVSANTVTLDHPIDLTPGEDYVLVPNTARRQNMQNIFSVQGAEGAVLNVAELTPGVVEVGNGVLVGPSYGTRQSDFNELLEYASERLRFYTIADIQAGRQLEAPLPSAFP